MEMPSSWGKRKGLPGYDKFRTGLTYDQVFAMMMDGSDDSKDWRYKRRRTVLGFWHELKLQLYEQARDRGYAEEEEQGLT